MNADSDPHATLGLTFQGAHSKITAHTEGMGLEIKAFDSGGSIESVQSTNYAMCPSHVFIHANVVKSYVFEGWFKVPYAIKF